MSQADADVGGVKQALEHLLAWPDIARSPQLANFLSYIVERRLAGEAQSIKAYSIAVDVFGRPQNFDPQADPIVRVQARRLRSLLEQYYRGPGLDEPLRIDLPIGRYVPDFVDATLVPPTKSIDGEPDAIRGGVSPPRRQAPEPHSALPRRRTHVTLSWFALLVLALGATALTYSLTTLSKRQEQRAAFQNVVQTPRLQVMEFQNLTGDATITPAVSGLAIELVKDFEPTLIVNASLGGREGNPGADRVRQADYVLSGIVRDDPAAHNALQFNAILTDMATNSIAWNWSVSVTRERLAQRGGVDLISQELITVIGGARGPLHDKARAYLTREDITGRETFYQCAVLFSMYRSTPTMGLTARTSSCIDALIARGSTDGNVLAARASLTAEVPIGSDVDADVQAQRYATANDLLDRAEDLAPTSYFVWEQRARLAESLGQHEQAESAYGTSLQINPANIDGMAAHARHLALIGRLSAAAPMAQRAISAVPQTSVPDWFYCVPALKALEDQSLVLAKRLAQICTRADVELGPILSLLTAEQSGDAPLVDQLLPQVMEVPSFRSAGILTQLERRIIDPHLRDAVKEALMQAGVPSHALYSAY